MAAHKKQTMIITSAEPSSKRLCRSSNARMVQNFHLIWVDGSIEEVNNDDYCKSITKLRQIVNTVNIFTDVDECVDFLSTSEKKSFYDVL